MPPQQHPHSPPQRTQSQHQPLSIPAKPPQQRQSQPRQQQQQQEQQQCPERQLYSTFCQATRSSTTPATPQCVRCPAVPKSSGIPRRNRPPSSPGPENFLFPAPSSHDKPSQHLAPSTLYNNSETRHAGHQSRTNPTAQTSFPPPLLTQEYALQHDTATAHLLLSHGGLGLTSATVTAPPAYWASWADTLPVLHQQLPAFTATLLQSLQHPHQPPQTFQAAIDAAQALRNAGWQPPDWPELTQPVRHPLPNPWTNHWRAADGNTRQPHQSTPATALNFWPASPLTVKLCSNHKAGPSPAEPSQPSLMALSSHIRPTCSEFCCSVVFDFPSRCLCVTAGAVALLTPLATTAQHVPHQELCEAARGH